MGRILLSATLAVLVSLSNSSVVKPPEGAFELLILHNNDMHARFEQTSQLSGACTAADRDAGKCYGGFPRVAHVVKEARAAAASGQGPPVLYLNAGDTYTGTAWFTIYKWKVAAEFLNALQPDAVSLSNDDFVKGPQPSPLLESLDASILSSNIVIRNQEFKNKFKKSEVHNVDGVQIGLVGYLTADSSILKSSSDIEYIDEILALKEEVAKLQSNNISIIIALGHSKLTEAIEIATEVDGIDLVINGHKNSYFWNGTNSETGPQSKNYIMVTQNSGKRVPVIESYAYNKHLGKAIVKFNSLGEMTDYDFTSITLDAAVPQDPETLQILLNLNKDMSMANTVLGYTAVVLDGESCRLEECNLGNLVADSMMYYYAIKYNGERWTDAPVAVIHGGAFAASIAPPNRPAGVTLKDLLTAVPSQNNLVTVTMNGTILLQMLEHSVVNYRFNNPPSQFLQFSGIRVVYDLDKAPGSRIVSAVVRCWDCFVPEFFSIDNWRAYKILMPETLANGQFGYSMLTGLPRENLNYDQATCTSEFIRIRTPVYPEVSGRIILLNIDSVPGSASKIYNSALSIILSIAAVLHFYNQIM